jgi:3-oxoacyl-[acyl-carrier-protein] synthase II
VTALGTGIEATWPRLVRGDRGIGPATILDVTGQRVGLVAEVSALEVPAVGGWSRTSAMAHLAASEALRDAKLDVRGARVGIVVGGTTGGMFETEHWLARLHAEPDLRGPLAEMRCHPLTATVDRLHEALGPFVRARTLSSACSSGANALVVAAGWLLSGDVDAVLAGGSDALCRLTLTGFNSLGVIDPEPCRPFDRRRRGTTLGEGAGFLILESEPAAAKRGAVPIAELAGWAQGSEAHHITHPAPDGAVVGVLVGCALDRAGLSPEDVDYVSAHATGTPASDGAEAGGLARGLGGEIGRIPVSSSKGQLGHTLAAAGAIEAVITALAVQRAVLVPTAGLDAPDPECALVHVPRVGTKVPRVRAAISNAFGFGGMDTVLVFCEPGLPKRTGTRQPAIAAIPRPSSDDPTVVTGVAVIGPTGLLGIRECAELLDGSAGACRPVDPDALLDPFRARRLDRASRLGAIVTAHAAQQARALTSDAGVVLGGAFGNVDESAAFMHRVLEKGPRSASPAEFPNLVQSSPVGHVTIYGGNHGPSFAVSDSSVSGEAAFAQGTELVREGEASLVIAGASEPRSSIVERVLGVLFEHAAGERVDLAAAVVLETGSRAELRGARMLARVSQLLQWRGAGGPILRGLRPPSGLRSEVIVARLDSATNAVLDETPWRSVPRRSCGPLLGESDALGAVAVACAAARIGRRMTTDALVLGIASDRGYAVVFEANVTGASEP